MTEYLIKYIRFVDKIHLNLEVHDADREKKNC